MKTEGIAVILVLAAWQAGAGQEKKKSEISLFDPFAIQAPLRPIQKKKLKVRKLRTTLKPKSVEEGRTENSISPDLVERPEVDYEAESHSRQETVDEDGNIVGSYSYKDPNGDLVVVRYVAGKDGYRVLADIPSDATETTPGISNDDWIQDIRRRTTRRTTTTIRSTTTTKTTTLPTSTVTPPLVLLQQEPFPTSFELNQNQQGYRQQQLGQRLFQNTQQPGAQHDMQLGQRLFQEPQQFDIKGQFVPKHDFTIQQQFTEQQQFEPQHQFTHKRQFTTNQQFIEKQQFTPQQQFTQQQQFNNQKQFTTQQQFTQQRQFPQHHSQQQQNQPQQMLVSQQASPQQQFITQQQFAPQQQSRSQSSPSLEESVLHQPLSHEQFLDNNRHRLFVQSKQSQQQQPAQQQQQQFQNTPQFSPQLFNQQNQQFQNGF